MRLLLTNDDGINAKGLYELAKELEKEHNIIIAAPCSQRSACGHSITLTTPIEVEEVKLQGINGKAYSINGTPADCVRIALDKLSEEKIDMVVSGINSGFNLGTDVIYSGTVSAAIESAIYKIPSLAISVEIKKEEEKYETAAKYAAEVLRIVKNKEIGDDVVLNVNVPLIPQEEIKGIKVCKIGSRVYKNSFIEKIENSEDIGKKRFKLEAELEDQDCEDTDIYYVKRGYVTLTPLHYDLTNFLILEQVSNMFNP
ncbi:5'/3'-nucleotidase SurE [Clostridium sp. DJ247]|uniref:5'/3'-nucleotidase SurE n=1 Tax=Clostridium sp. DJ247 TaxID=2726188 RepID=UPI00162894E9|nr:5'/3'-nucleotidase SurE [Clostridium sp. DJ247]MBC2579467.1 5'/3'-nucleotidase SurE [Clostridium sp. DJ247]